MYPDHAEQLSRLSKVEGQIKGIRKMIEERRYCIDIMNQMKAVCGALRQIQMGVLESHLHHCIYEAVAAREPDLVRRKLDEVVGLFAQME